MTRLTGAPARAGASLRRAADPWLPERPADARHGGRLSTRPVPPGHLFVSGCERSGTTVLTRLLQSHPRVAIGMERYKYLLRTVRTQRIARRLNPSHFEPGRFFDFRATDTNIAPPNFATYHRQTEERYRNPDLRYVGDKVLPPSTKIYARIASRFPGARYVFIYRDVVAVASSFEVRARDPDDIWPESHGYELGVDHWIRAFEACDALIADVGADAVFVVRYEDLFDGSTDAAAALFAWLDLDLDPAVRAFLDERTTGWAERVARAPVLHDDQLAAVRCRVDPLVVARFAARADWRLETAGAAGPASP